MYARSFGSTYAPIFPRPTAAPCSCRVRAPGLEHLPALPSSRMPHGVACPAALRMASDANGGVRAGGHEKRARRGEAIYRWPSSQGAATVEVKRRRTRVPTAPADGPCDSDAQRTENPEAREAACAAAPSPAVEGSPAEKGTQASPASSASLGLADVDFDFNFRCADKRESKGRLADPLDSLMPAIRAASTTRDLNAHNHNDCLFRGFGDEQEAYRSIQAALRSVFEDERTHRDLADDSDVLYNHLCPTPFAARAGGEEYGAEGERGGGRGCGERKGEAFFWKSSRPQENWSTGRDDGRACATGPLHEMRCV